MSNQRTVLVIGARGVLGSLTADAFAQTGWTVRRAARDGDKAEGTESIDLDEPIEPSVLAGADLIVNTVPHPGFAVERAVLDHGGTLINVSAISNHLTQPLREHPTEPHGLVILGAGLAPGITNLVAADLIAREPDADTIEIALAVSLSAISGRAGLQWGYEHIATANRRFRTTIPFPQPLGARRCLDFTLDESGWLESLTPGKAVHTHLCLAEAPANDALQLLTRTGLLRRLPRVLFTGRPATARTPPSSERVLHWVAVGRHGRRIAARTIECAGDYPSTARATAALANHLDNDPARSLWGCRDAHDIWSLKDVAADLQQARIRIVEQQVG